MDMSNADNNQLWFRIANLIPKIRAHVSFVRQEYRGEIWYIYQDHSTNRFHRLDYYAHQFLGLMNGDRSVQDIVKILKSKHNSPPYTQEEIFQLLGQLHRIDLLQTNANPDSLELYNRAQQQQTKRWKMFLRNPISFRVALFDPEKLLTKALPAVSPLFTKLGFSLFLFILIVAALFASSYWGALSSNSIEQAFLPKNILLLIIIYPFVKLLHALGHAFAVKYWGGEVHEIGVIFVLLLPIPYVDASAASAFPHKRQRITVGAAGIMVELFLACIALFVWLAVEQGMVQTIAFNVMLIAGISTLLFNGNPLLRYDGYFVFSDAIEIPNIASRSNRYIGYLIQRYIFRVDGASSPAHDVGERFWFFCYSPAAFIYRMIILTIVVMLVADREFIIGALLGGWILYNQLLLPIIKHAKFIFVGPKLSQHRLRAIFSSSAIVFFIGGILFALPFPLVTITQGIIWPSDNSRIHVASPGFVTELLIESGSFISKGDTLIVLDDPLLSSRIKILEAQLQELESQYNLAWSTKRVQREIIKEKMSSLQATLNQSYTQREALHIQSPFDGKIIIPGFHNLDGQYLEQGNFIAYIVAPSKITARAVFRQDDMGLLSKVDAVDIAYSGDMSRSIPATIKQIIPEISHQLPSAALGTVGGGNVAVDPLDKTGLKAIEKLQQIEIELDANNDETSYIGKRIYVRFDHGTAPLAQQWYKSMQQLLLRRFSV